MTKDGHFKDELQDLLSGQLNPSEAADVENHLKTCSECRQEFESLQLTKRILANHLQKAQLPADLQANITKLTEPPASKSSWKNLLPYAAALILILAGILYYFGKRSDLATEVTKDFHRYESERSLQLFTNDEKRLERFYTEQGMPFPVGVYDLRMMNYELVGGSIHDLKDHKAGLYVYRGKQNEILICEMYLGEPSELPAGAAIRQHKGTPFHIYSKNGVTAVFWQDGKVMCVLISDIDPERIIQVAFAKAKPDQ